MKFTATLLAVSLAATPVFAGNPDTPAFEDESITRPDQPIGSQANWIIPVIAIALVAAAVAVASSDDDDGGGGGKVLPTSNR